jgi:hypothetical protein
MVQSKNLDVLKACLDAGGYVVCSMGNGYWTKSGHYICAWKYDTKYIYCNDPASSKRTKQNISDFMRERKQFFAFYPEREGEPEKKPETVKRGDKIVEVKIPAGVSEGMALTLQGMGNAARHGGISGDLIVVIKEEEHPDFERSGNNLVHNLRISVTTAILGGDAEVPTIDGRVRINIEAGTQSGKVMRLRGKGLPDVNGRGRGDIIIVVDVVIPTELTKEERKLVEQLSEQPNFKQAESKQDQDILSRMKNFFR